MIRKNKTKLLLFFRYFLFLLPLYSYFSGGLAKVADVNISASVQYKESEDGLDAIKFLSRSLFHIKAASLFLQHEHDINSIPFIFFDAAIGNIALATNSLQKYRKKEKNENDRLIKRCYKLLEKVYVSIQLLSSFLTLDQVKASIGIIENSYQEIDSLLQATK